MPKQVELHDETFERLQDFKCVSEQITGDEYSTSELVEILVNVGIQTTLASLWSSLEPEAMLAVLQQMAQRAPAETYKLVAEHLSQGNDAEQQRMKNFFGFKPPSAQS